MAAEHGYYLEDLEVGQSESLSKTVSQNDIELFAQVTGDNNPVHVDPEFAAGTMFKEPIAHGMLNAGYISAVLGTKLPGPGAIYVEQSLRFKAPVKIGDEVTTTVTVEEINERRRRVRFSTVCRIGDKVVTQGEALMMVDSKEA